MSGCLIEQEATEITEILRGSPMKTNGMSGKLFLVRLLKVDTFQIDCRFAQKLIRKCAQQRIFFTRMALQATVLGPDLTQHHDPIWSRMSYDLFAIEQPLQRVTTARQDRVGRLLTIGYPGVADNCDS